jgi:hypothetical protein
MYQKVKKNVDPKEKKLIEAQQHLDLVDSMLAEKKIVLANIQEKVSELNKQLSKSQVISNQLNQQIVVART